LEPKLLFFFALLAASCSGKGSAPRGVDLSKDCSAVIAPMLLSIPEASIARGVGGLVAIAECVAASSARFHRTIRMIAFSCEERGQLGSKDYAKSVDPKDIVAVVNQDAIAPLPTDRSSPVYHYRYSEEEIPAWLPKMLASIAQRYRDSTGIRAAYYWGGAGCSFDSRAFELRGIPATSILGIGNPPANTLRDAIGQVDAAYGRDVARFAAAAALSLAGPIENKQATAAGRAYEESAQCPKRRR
jgi:hypothetical protein